MHYSVEMLVRGRAEVVEYYRVAAERWGEIWHRPDAHDLARLSKMLSSEQMWFKGNCGGLGRSGSHGRFGVSRSVQHRSRVRRQTRTSPPAVRRLPAVLQRRGRRASRRKSLGPTTSSTKVECDAVMVRGDGR